MKKFLTILLAGASTLAIAQKRTNLSRSIDDDGKTLSIRVTGTIDGKEIDYNRSFDVEELSKEERMALRDKVLDSIQEGNMNLPEPPRPRSAAKAAPAVVATPPEPEPVVYSSASTEHHAMAEQVHGAPARTDDSKDFSKHVRYNRESGEMFMKYRFMKNKDEYIYEKTVNAIDKSENQRLRIVEDFEREIELPGKGLEM